MIATSETLDLFNRMLAQAGFDAARPDPLLAWRVFKEFATVLVDCADDALLFQVGTHSFTGRELFHFDFTRQFIHEEGGEYECMEHLHFTIYYEPNEELRRLSCNVWSYDCSSLHELFRRVEAMPEFQIPTRSHVPLRARIGQEVV